MVSEAEVTPEMQHLTTSHSKGELVSKENQTPSTFLRTKAETFE